jgi:hypothetical protein
MKYDLKILSLVVILGSLFYCISSYTKSKLIANSPKKDTKEVIVINKTENSSKSIAPKVYISVPAQNYLGVGSNINSKR